MSLIHTSPHVIQNININININHVASDMLQCLDGVLNTKRRQLFDFKGQNHYTTPAFLALAATTPFVLLSLISDLRLTARSIRASLRRPSG